MFDLRKIPAPVWYLAAAAAVAVLIRRQLGALLGKAADAAQGAGEAVSGTVFDALHPSLSAAVFNQPTIVDATLKPGAVTNGIIAPGANDYTCPDGYTLKYGRSRGWYCLRDS